MRRAYKKTGVLIATAGVALITGCGASNNPAPTQTAQVATNMPPTGNNSPAPQTTPRVWNEATLSKAMGLTPQGGGTYTFQAGDTTCNVAVVMTTASQVAMYAYAGDAVATNQDRSAGVKIVSDQTKTCIDAANAKLAKM